MSSGARTKLGSRLFWWACPCVVLLIVVPASARTGVLWTYNVLLAVAFFLDARRLTQAQLALSREAPARATRDSQTAVQLALTNASPVSLHAWVRDVLPEGCVIDPPVLKTQLAPDSTQRLAYTLKPRLRGKHHFGDLHLRVETELGLAAADLTFLASQPLFVMPGSAQKDRRALLGPRDEAGDARARLLRAPQSGGELESLREYVAGDALRSMDWKATAKRRHPITRVFQPERSQILWLVLDASRTMAATLRDGDEDGLGARTRFDLALEVALDLSQRALLLGDQVGALVFGDRRVLLIPPRRGRAQQRVLTDALCQVVPEPVQLDVRGLIAELERCAKKRALLIMFSDLENEAHGELLAEHAPMLRRKHINLLVSLDDAVTENLVNGFPSTEDSAYLMAAAADQLRERHGLRSRLSSRGFVVLEASEAKLFPATLDKYLTLKTSQRL